MMHTTDALREQVIHDEGIPATVRKFLSQGAALEDIRLDAYGRWFHEGEPFINQNLARLFHRSLRRTDQGTWFLHIEPYSYPVTVELTDAFIDRLKNVQQHTYAHFVGDDRDQWTAISLEPLYSDAQEILAIEHGGRAVRFVKQAYRDLSEHLAFEGEGFALQLPDHTLPILTLPEHFFTPKLSRKVSRDTAT